MAADEHCPNIQRCPVFPLIEGRALLQVLKIQYCEGRFTRCRRYASMQSGVVPPATLLPDGSHVEGPSD
jgi:hypothetical protein